MKIKLVGALPQKLKDLGLTPGEIFYAEPAPNTKLGAVRFLIFKDDEWQFVTVYPENFKKL